MSIVKRLGPVAVAAVLVGSALAPHGLFSGRRFFSRSVAGRVQSPDPLGIRITKVYDSKISARVYGSEISRVEDQGFNASGQLGDGTKILRRKPVQVKNLTGVIAVRGGADFSMALTSDHTVWTWGLNTNGELGNGTSTQSSVPVHVSGLTGVTAIGGGRYHAMAVKSDGTVWSWGLNGQGELGDGTTSDRHSPVRTLGITTAVAVVRVMRIPFPPGWCRTP